MSRRELRIRLPSGWTAREALVAAGLLNELLAAIWEEYGEEMWPLVWGEEEADEVGVEEEAG